MSDTNDDKNNQWLMAPEEREKWERIRKRGKSRFLLQTACVISFAATAFLIFLTIMFTDGWREESLLARLPFFLVPGIITGVTCASLIGSPLWSSMERRYQASLNYNPTESELRISRAERRRQLPMVLPLIAALGAYFLPKPFSPSLAFVFFGLTPFFLVFHAISIKDRTYSSRNYGTVPIASLTAISEISKTLLLGIPIIVLGLSFLYRDLHGE